MIAFRYELYTRDSRGLKDTDIAGRAYVGDICGTSRVSVNEVNDVFQTASLAAHELGHK